MDLAPEPRRLEGYPPTTCKLIKDTRINNAGQIVGTFHIAGEINRHGFLRTATGTFTTIDVPGAIHTTLTGINDAGEIVAKTRGWRGGQNVEIRRRFGCCTVHS